MDGTLIFPDEHSFQLGKSPRAVSFMSNNDITGLVTSASRVIAPLGPINSFAARSPWMGLENQSLDEVARWLKGVRDVDIYPSASLLKEAKNRGDIDPKFLEKGLQLWLDSQTLKLSRDIAERFCWAALQPDTLSANFLAEAELKGLEQKLSSLVLPVMKTKPMQTLSFRFEQQSGVKVECELNCHMIKWCRLFLGESDAAWSLPNSKEGFYRAWRRLAPYDPALNRSQRLLLKKCPQEASSALKEALSALKISPPQIQDYLEAHLLSLPGWAGTMLWRSQEAPQEKSLLTEYLAVRISMEWALMQPYLPLSEPQLDEQQLQIRLIAAWAQWGDLPIEAWSQLSATQKRARLMLAYRFDDFLCRRLWLEAWEQTYDARLQQMITDQQSVTLADKPVLAQLAFCIDTRSERFRRFLERAGPFETFGVAGFFGLPIETSELGNKHSHASLPVMLKPRHRIKEVTSVVDFEQYQQRLNAAHTVTRTFRTMKQNMLTSLLLPEVTGPWLSLQMLARSFFPRAAGHFFGQLRRKWLQKPATELSLENVYTEESDLPLGFSETEKVQYARQALRMMGLTENFAPLVVICGHGSYSTNNAYAAALDCGACGGASGGLNARVLATLCNQTKVRETLAREGISIPENTVFAATEHITTSNELRWLYVPELSGPAQQAFDRIQDALPKVSKLANAEQLSQVPAMNLRSKKPNNEVQRLSEDWSEVRPEWGLAGNAAFIIGTRRRTKECNLGGRVFLHTYDWQKDPDGAILSNIIAGPATVAQWINLQYYASTVAPHYYGSGNKATQTVTAGIGVMQGNVSDLLCGLPWQSYMKSDLDFYHAPLRLLILIEAPHEYVERLLDHNLVFRQKIQNGWLRLATIDPKGRWEIWDK